MKKSLAFYRDILGLPLKRSMKPSDTMELAFLGEGETEVELICNKENTAPAFGKDISLGFIVPSIEAFQETMKKHNIPLLAGPFQPNPSIRFVYISDPDGLKIQLVQRLG